MTTEQISAGPFQNKPLIAIACTGNNDMGSRSTEARCKAVQHWDKCVSTSISCPATDCCNRSIGGPLTKSVVDTDKSPVFAFIYLCAACTFTTPAYPTRSEGNEHKCAYDPEGNVKTYIVHLFRCCITLYLQWLSGSYCIWKLYCSLDFKKYCNYSQRVAKSTPSWFQSWTATWQKGACITERKCWTAGGIYQNHPIASASIWPHQPLAMRSCPTELYAFIIPWYFHSLFPLCASVGLEDAAASVAGLAAGKCKLNIPYTLPLHSRTFRNMFEHIRLNLLLQC